MGVARLQVVPIVADRRLASSRKATLGPLGHGRSQGVEKLWRTVVADNVKQSPVPRPGRRGECSYGSYGWYDVLPSNMGWWSQVTFFINCLKGSRSPIQWHHISCEKLNSLGGAHSPCSRHQVVGVHPRIRWSMTLSAYCELHRIAIWSLSSGYCTYIYIYIHIYIYMCVCVCTFITTHLWYIPCLAQALQSQNQR